MTRSKRADRMEAILRRADASLEAWFVRARKRSAGILRHRIDDLQAGLKKVSAGLEPLERDRKVLLPPDAATKPKPTKRRTRAPIARKPAAARKHKKAA